MKYSFIWLCEFNVFAFLLKFTHTHTHTHTHTFVSLQYDNSCSSMVHNVQGEHEAHTGDAWHELHLISLQVFHDTEHNLHQLGAGDDTLHTHLHARTCARTHTHTNTFARKKGISITNDWKKMMMTNNYVLQGQKYTNGVGAVPQRMMGSASDICSLQMVHRTLSTVSSWSTREHSQHPSELYCLAGTWPSGLSQAFVASEVMLHSEQLDNTGIFKIIMSSHYARMVLYYNSIIWVFKAPKLSALWIFAQVVYL